MKRYGGKTVTAIICYPQDKILLIRRDTLPFKGYWALPGGRLEVGETSEQACVREVREETGLDIEIVCKVGNYHEHGFRERIYYDYYPACFVVRVVGGQVIRQESEVQEIGFFSFAELPVPLAFEHDQMLNDYKKMVK